MRLNGITDSGLRRVARHLRGGLTSYIPGMTLEEVLGLWVEDGLVFEDDKMPIYFDLDDLWPYREYEWSRDEARLFPEEWDELKSSMEAEGFSEDHPVLVMLGRNGVMKVGEGNHRLAIAKELGIDQIPVRFVWQQEVWHNPQLTKEEREQKALEWAQQERKREQESAETQEWWDSLTPEEREEMDNLVDLLL